ncbi:MAG TPA: iron-containing alcohol dehydrogenase [Propionibacteriaceae bacterium]|nr:iron-containing alcohol dehydrogenase [Propionibacteriaceae bacterium]
MRFEIATPAEIRFGAGRATEVPEALAGLGVRRALVITGATPQRADGVRVALADAGIASEVFPVSGEPSLDVVRAGVSAFTRAGCDGVLGYGGGSALDAAKAVAALAASGTDPLEHLEVIGEGQPLTVPSLPCVAVPTTAGTGSEVTRNAVLSAGQTKASLRSPSLLPRMAIVDPDLLRGLPQSAIASGGLDALSQVLEPFLSARANPFADAMAREGMQRSARSLRRAWDYEMDSDPAIREDLAIVSLFGGLCLANSGLGAVHGFAAALGARFEAPHGAVCGALLPATFEANWRALRQRDPDHPALARMSEVARLLTGDPTANVEAAVIWLKNLKESLGVPGLAPYGLTDSQIPALVEAAKKANSMRANPITLSDEELAEILARSL